MVSRINQLNVPIDSELKERWKHWAKMRGTTLSALVEGLALACVEGRPLELPGVEVSAPAGEGVEDLKKSILAELRGIVEGEVSKAIADQTKILQESENGTDAENRQSSENSQLDETLPDWLIPGKEYTQLELGKLMGISNSTVSKKFKDIDQGLDPGTYNQDLKKLIELNKQKLFIKQGTRWIYKQ